MTKQIDQIRVSELMQDQFFIVFEKLRPQTIPTTRAFRVIACQDRDEH